MGNRKYLDLLRKELVLFFDELILLLPEERDLLVIKLLVQDVINMTDVMEYIHTRLAPLEHYVKDKNESFFLERCVLFDTLGGDSLQKVDYFKQIWKHEQDDTKDMIWNWFEHFISLSKKYYA